MAEPRTKPRKSTAKVATSETESTVRNGVDEAGDASVSHDDIARRAYELAHGDERGNDEENWLRAEEELRGRHLRSS